VDSFDVSVVVPSYRSRDTIERCLEALRVQATERRYEVILVDSSDDGTERLVAERFPPERFPALRLIHIPERALPGGARNVGIRAARGPIVALTDADCVVGPDWIERLARRHASADLSAVGGAVDNGLPRSAVAWSGLWVEFNEFLARMPERTTELLPTCNVAFRREVFERRGLFPEDLWPSEDHVFSQRLADAGEVLLFDPALRVAHLFRPTLGGFLRHQRRLGAASAAARRQVVDLPHAWIATSPLRWLVPLLRLARIEARLLVNDLPNLIRFNALLPLCLPGLLMWGLGFCRGFGPAEEATR
jgi:GT2 family glycosyltransferase